ncbi:MAG TPA: F0F1 ATP synthase subunit alpha [Planctomycetes bacterium]|nr:F0F1 ATP synthase subunit alpha [Planctomycetota bacterium]
MDINPAEITSVLKKEIESYDQSVEVESIGTLISIGDGVARVSGLKDCRMSEMLEFPGDRYGIALNLESDSVGAVVLGDYTTLEEGDTVKATGEIMSVPVGEGMLGRVVNAIGEPIDGKGPINSDTRYPVEGRAPNVLERQPVSEPVQTGIMAVDAMIPIGRGQRELIIGDRQTGKTALCVDTIINQKGKDLICIYVAVGQKMSTVKAVQEVLEKTGAMDYTIIVNAPASESAAMQWLAPFAGTAMGEYFRDRGKHALVIYDDLYKHAMAWREVSLLLRRPPGREAFPGDVFALHSRLLERSAKLADDAHEQNPKQYKAGGGSLTALPIVEIQQGDVTAYIPTNVISITDGQIYLETDLFNAGIRPAVNVGLSVSRVGGSAQIKAMKKVAGQLRLEMAQFRELAAFTQFASDLDAATLAQLTRGERLVEVLKQPQYEPLAVEDQIFIIIAGTQRFLDDIPKDSVKKFEKEFLQYMRDSHPEIGREIVTSGKLSEEAMKGIREALTTFKKTFSA